MTETEDGGRQRAEAELAEKEAQLRVALDNMRGGMTLVDRDLNYVLFNARYSEQYDFPDGLIEVGGSMLDALRYLAERGDFGPGDKDDLIEQVVAKYRKGEAVSLERTIAGSGRALLIYGAPTPEGGYVTIATDITERKPAEAALRESQQRLSTLLANLPGIAYRGANDRDWGMEFLSEGCRALTGYAPEDLIECETVTYADLVHPDDREELWNQVQAALREQRPYQVEYRISPRDGSEKWVWEQGCGVFGPDGDLQALEGFITDITELEEYRDHLEELGAKRTVLDWDGALRRFDNNEELLLELAAMFLDECPKLMAAIETARSSGDTSELRRAAHTLKGSAQIVGARAAATAASRLEELGRDGELEAVPNAQRMLAAELSRLRPVLQKAAAGAD